MVANKLSSHDPFTSTHRVLDHVKRNMMSESAGRFAGPLTLRQFLEDFVPAPEGVEMPNVSFDEVAKAQKEVDMYGPFITACKTLDTNERMIYRDSSSTVDPKTVPLGVTNRDGLKPDVMTYQKGNEPKNGMTTDFSLADRWDEFKYVSTDDPFSDKPHDGDFPFESTSEFGKDTRGQICAYASAMFRLQFRSFFFSILILGRYARLIRWDRSGAIVTRAFNYVKDPRPLARFIWRYSYLTPAQRGYDESVELIRNYLENPAVLEARSAFNKHPIEGLARHLYYLRMSPIRTPTTSPPPAQSCLPLADVPPKSLAEETSVSDNEDEDSEWDYILRGPEYTDRGPFGKMTRSLLVYDLQSKKVRHLKDTHRLLSDQHEPEHEILETLRAKGVQRICTVHEAWDVSPYGQYYDSVFPWYFHEMKKKFIPKNRDALQRASAMLRSYRLITVELGRELWKFKNWKEVTQVIVDTLRVLDDVEEAGIRHRDMSVGNIMIYEGRGLVIDWDASQYVHKMNQGKPGQPDQTGTWQFISAKRLLDPFASHERTDDMESVFWVLLWLALKLGHHTLEPEDLKETLQETFDAASRLSVGHKGGRAKLTILQNKLMVMLRTTFGPPGLNECLIRIHSILQPRYSVPAMRKPLRPGPEAARKAEAIYKFDMEMHQEAMDCLANAQHLCQALQDCLDQESWPTINDGPHKNLIPANYSESRPTRKRRSDAPSAIEAAALARIPPICDPIRSQDPPAKKRRLDQRTAVPPERTGMAQEIHVEDIGDDVEMTDSDELDHTDVEGPASEGGIDPLLSHSGSSPPLVLDEHLELLALLTHHPADMADWVPSIHPRGLANLGNMCFANAVLQALVYCPPFSRLFGDLGRRLPGVVEGNHKERTSLVDATVQFLREFEGPEGRRARKGQKHKQANTVNDKWAANPITPTYVYDAMKENKRFKSMRGGYQEDAQEFLGFYLEALEEELLTILNALTPAAPKVAEQSPAQQDVGTGEIGKQDSTTVTRNPKSIESPITKIFGGKFQSTLRGPDQDSVRVEGWRTLQLDIQPQSVVTIDDALQHLSHPQRVQMKSPTRVGQTVDGSQTVLIAALPPILVLHLKRFLYDPNVRDTVKIGKKVMFKPDLVICTDIMAEPAKTIAQPAKYKLFGVVYHHGQSASSGHYTLDVLHPNRYPGHHPRESWMRIDDALVSVVSTDDVFGGLEHDDRCAYLLFYQRV